MKSHFLSIWFEIGKQSFYFSGRVIGEDRNGKVIISANKLFKKAFGFDLPDYACIKVI